MPSEATVRGWVIDHVDERFSAQYPRARELQALRWAEEILEISDDGTKDTIEDENGNKRLNGEWLQRSKLRVDTRKWLLSKVLPKIYGDRLNANLTGDITARVTDDREPVSTLKLAREIAFALHLGVQEAAANKAHGAEE